MKISRRKFHYLLGGAIGVCGLSERYAWSSGFSGEKGLELQPFAGQVTRLLKALEFIGEPLPPSSISAINTAITRSDGPAAISQVEEILDKYVLMNVQINPESRISVTRGQAKAQLVEQGWRSFLVRVNNQAGDTSALKIHCPQAQPMGRKSQQSIVGVHDTTNGAVDVVDAQSRWTAVEMWDKPPLEPTLSGLAVEYRILQMYSRDHGQREASLEADAGLGEQDLGFRSTLSILFDCIPTNDIDLRISDVDGRPTTASLLISDSLGRIYPMQSKRPLPDLWFERQIYRRDGETLRLPAGKYSIECGRGPEYLRKRMSVSIEKAVPPPILISLDRWVTPSHFGYYSGDTHIHAAGCSHYESPYEGVTPEVMLRQVQGEALDIGDVLTWAPGYYYQKQFFSSHIHNFASDTGPQHHWNAELDKDAPTKGALLKYDIEVSGFPSSHCGHLVLLRLVEQEYPNTKTIDEWPSWNLPILKWAKAQGAVVGYAHSAGGLTVDSTELPNYLMPRFDSSGANEYIVDVTHENVVDFISGCDLWPAAELNIWYHTLNCGFRTSFAGETDFPCISDEHVGGGRSYVRLAAPPTDDRGYGDWVSGVKAGHSYVGDGRSHLFSFSIKHGESTDKDNQLLLDGATIVRVSAQVCARLEPEISELTEKIRNASPYNQPYWHLERARIESSRSVPVELIVNGISVQRKIITADGSVQEVAFDVLVQQSSWIAIRILPSAHTNPMFVLINGKPIRASKKSAEWCRQAVDVCWSSKAPRIRPSELKEAEKAYEHARGVFAQVVLECEP